MAVRTTPLQIELSKLQQDLDHDALQLEARKNESEERRKALVTQVKAFRGALAEVPLVAWHIKDWKRTHSSFAIFRMFASNSHP